MKAPQLIHPTTNKRVTANYANVVRVAKLIPFSRLDAKWQTLINGYKTLGYPVAITEEGPHMVACSQWVEKQMAHVPTHFSSNHHCSPRYMKRVRSFPLLRKSDEGNTCLHVKTTDGCGIYFVTGTDVREIAKFLTDIVVQYPPAGYATTVSFLGVDTTDASMVVMIAHDLPEN